MVSFPRIRRRLTRLGLGHVQLTPDVTNQRDHDKCVEIFDRLVEDKQLDVIEALIAGDVSWGELLYAERRQELTGTKIMAKVKLGRPLWPTTEKGIEVPGAIAATLPLMGRSSATRKRYTVSLEALRRQTIVPWPAAPMRVSHLEALDWNALAAGWTKSEADWNHVVRAVRAFLTKYLGSARHEFRERLGKLTPMLPEDERVPDISPELFARIRDQLPPHAKAIAMGLLLTGMRDRTEFFRASEADLMPATCQVKIPGRHTKTKRGRYAAVDESMWPWIVASIPAPIGYQQFLRHWHRACVAVGAGHYAPTGGVKVVRIKLQTGQRYGGGQRYAVGKTPQLTEVPAVRYTGLRPHDLRHALAQWTHDAGRSLSQIKDVLGHSNIAQSERYARSANRRAVAGTQAEIISQRVDK
ncbi:MAG: hypothetical protein JWM41_863 [Gemmatimonadetes bacterium]|nr:hypothetical protein [Gemmatimonadota bacterium]